MSLSEEYRRQFLWRDWQRALTLCPIKPGEQVVDLGCGPGDIAAELEARGAVVTGIDSSPELLTVASRRAPAARFEQQDLSKLALLSRFDGLWCSFTAAYFVDFATRFAQWCTFLRPDAWDCLVDVDDLLGHVPRTETTRGTIEGFYADAFAKGRYDFRIGRRLRSILESQGFEVEQYDLNDLELAFDGAATPEVLNAGRARFARMGGLKAYLGNAFAAFTDGFIRTLESEEHRSLCRVRCCVGTR